MTGIAPVLKVFSLLVVFKSLVMHVTEEELVNRDNIFRMFKKQVLI